MPEETTSLFAPVIAGLLDALPQHATTCPPTRELASRESSGVRMDAFARLLPGLGEVRAVHIFSPRAEIMNLFFFPVVTAPIFVIELVAFGKKPVVAVIDAKGVEPCGVALGAEILRAAHARHPGLPRGDDAPAWFEECRSGHDFFVRPADLAQFETLATVLHEVWHDLRDKIPRCPPAGEADLVAVQHYKDHHRLHSPGRPFLHRVFGEAWTEAFMRDFLFAPPIARPEQT